MQLLKIAYFGTPDFSAYFLGKLLKNKIFDIKLVVTQEDKKVGRKQILTASPVKQIAGKSSTPKFFSELSLQSEKNLMSSLKQVDLALVYAFGEMIPAELLEVPKYGFWNIHPSLLPKYRGASPVAGALIDGERETGVTIIKLDEKMDHGPIIAQEKVKILPKERRPELTMRLTDVAYEMLEGLVKELTGSRVNGLKFKNQNHSKATYTKLLKKSDGFIPFENWKVKIENSPEKVFNLFRGLYPWPGIWTLLRSKSFGGQAKRLKITDMDFYPERSRMGGGSLVIKKVQLEGKREVDFETFNKAYKIFKD